MPLSEHEQRLLDEMERHLYRNDADVMSSASAKRGLSVRSVVAGALLALVGFAVVLGALSAQLVWLGLIGFVLVIVGAVVGLRPGRHIEGGSAPTASTRQRTGFMDRMNDRWDRRTS